VVKEKEAQLTVVEEEDLEQNASIEANQVVPALPPRFTPAGLIVNRPINKQKTMSKK